MFEDGRTRELDYSIRLYALHELGKMLHECGFKVVEVTGHPAHPGVFFGSESPRLIILAERELTLPEWRPVRPGARDRLDARCRALPRSASPVDRITYARDLWPRHHLAVSRGAHRRAPARRRRLAARRPRRSPRSCASARAEGVPLVPFGAGSGVCGGVLPGRAHGRARPQAHRALARARPRRAARSRSRPGALGIRLEEELEARGLHARPLPLVASSARPSAAGSRRAAPASARACYGKIEDMVASLECVVGRGEIVRFQRRVHGPDSRR